MDLIQWKAILDSAIIGVLCYVGTSIIGTPYAILVSVIVGVTNVIPFFWTVHRCDSKCDTAFVDRSDQRTLLFSVHYLLAAVGWKYHRAEDSWRFYRTVCVLGSLFDFILEEDCSDLRYDYGSANICSGSIICSKCLSTRIWRKSNLPTDSAVYDDTSYVDAESGEFIHGSNDEQNIGEAQVRGKEDCEKEEEK